MSNAAEPSEPVLLARDFRNQLLRNGRGHYNAAQTARRKHQAIGVCAAVLSAAAGSALLTAGGDSTLLSTFAGGVGLAVSALAGLQTSLNYGATAADHTAAGRRFASLRKEFDIAIARMDTVSVDDQLANVDELRTKWELAAMESPLIPAWADRKAVRKLASERNDRLIR
jgi:hypothetical protein